jgi:hypothetical protein
MWVYLEDNQKSEYMYLRDSKDKIRASKWEVAQKVFVSNTRNYLKIVVSLMVASVFSGTRWRCKRAISGRGRQKY